MRYYDLAISNPDLGTIYTLPLSGSYFDQMQTSGSTFSSLYTSPVTGQVGPNPGALNIEFDATVFEQGVPQGQTLIRVWGIGLGMLSNAADLSGSNFTLTAGMSPGLPLATAAFQNLQQGIVLQGQVVQSFGNWQGVNQSLDLLCLPGAISPSSGIFFNWEAGTPLLPALKNALTAAYNDYSYDISIFNLVAPSTQSGWYDNLNSFAESLNGLTELLGPSQGAGADYGGVIITVQLNTFVVYDQTQPPRQVKQLLFQDLIGQPTWLSAAVISFKTVLRGDLRLGDTIKMPQNLTPPYVGFAPNLSVPNGPDKSRSLFQNNFIIKEVHHFANFRQPDADAWATAFLAVPAGTPQ